MKKYLNSFIAFTTLTLAALSSSAQQAGPSWIRDVNYSQTGASPFGYMTPEQYRMQLLMLAQWLQMNQVSGDRDTYTSRYYYGGVDVVTREYQTPSSSREDRDVTPRQQTQEVRVQQASYSTNGSLLQDSGGDDLTQIKNAALRAGVPDRAFEMMRSTYNRFKHRLGNQRFVTIIDYSQSSRLERMFVLDLASGNIRTMKVTHGAGSDKVRDGYVERLGQGKHQTPPGFHLTAEVNYAHRKSIRGKVIRMDGLETVNNKTRGRGVIIHQADYASQDEPGRSWGCPAVPPEEMRYLTDNIAGGSLILHYNDSYRGPQFQSETQLARAFDSSRSWAVANNKRQLLGDQSVVTAENKDGVTTAL